MENAKNVVADDLFAAYAAQMKKKAEEKPKSGQSFTPKEFDHIQWTGLETGRYKTYRFVGAPPNAEALGYTRDPTDSKLLIFTELKDDNDKKMQLRLPLRGEIAGKDHILHRLASKAMEVEYVKVKDKDKKQKVYKNKERFPDLVDWVEKGGFTEKDGFSFTYAKGLNGQQVVVFNVIDRNDDWCKENKHTKLLSKQISIGNDGQIIFPSIGVGAYGFCVTRDGLSPLDKLITSKTGGSYEKFDIAVLRTGKKEEPYTLVNASFLKKAAADFTSVGNLEAADGQYAQIENNDGTEFCWDNVKLGPLSAEELLYERYDIDKLMQVTSYQKILKRIPNVFKLCDDSLGTNFYDELTKLAEKEKAEYDKVNELSVEKEAAEVSKQMDIIKQVDSNEVIEDIISDKDVKETEKRVTRVVENTDNSKITEKDLPFYNSLKDSEKVQIKDVAVKNDKITSIVFTDDAKGVLECDNKLSDGSQCKFRVPSDWTSCPMCGCKYIIEAS